MTKILSSALAIDQGDVLVFSDLEDGGEMWTGKGDRSRTARVNFREQFREKPMVSLGIKMIDADGGANLRYDLILEDVSATGFNIRFKTWGDTKIARASVNWGAIGAAYSDNDWDDVDPY
jgi:hypothetical protein